jgi:hypothetical protein
MIDLTALSNRQLLEVWTGSLEELRRREVVRTYNNPIGDIAEAIVARHYGGVRGSFVQAGWDVAVGEERFCRSRHAGARPLRRRLVSRRCDTATVTRHWSSWCSRLT